MQEQMPKCLNCKPWQVSCLRREARSLIAAKPDAACRNTRPAITGVCRFLVLYTILRKSTGELIR